MWDLHSSQGERYILHPLSSERREFSTLEAAKAAAQADYESRINPGKEVAQPERQSINPSIRESDTAPAGLSAGGGAGWQPIETAPKDRVIDLWSSRGFRYTDAFWDITEYRLRHDPRAMEYGWTDKNHHGSIEEGGPYTHWRYPPEPPTTKGGE